MLMNYLCDSDSQAAKEDSKLTLRILSPVGQVMEHRGLIRVPLVVIEGFTNLEAQEVEAVEDRSCRRKIDPLLQRLVACDGKKNTFMRDSKEVIREFYLAKSLNFLGRAVKAYPLSITDRHVRVWGKHVVMELYVLECFAKDQALQVIDLDVLATGSKRWNVHELKLKSLQYQSGGYEYGKGVHQNKDPEKRHGKDVATWERLGYFNLEHFRGANDRKLFTIPFGARGMQGWLEGDTDVGHLAIIPGLVDAANASAVCSMPLYVPRFRVEFGVVVKKLVDRVKECYNWLSRGDEVARDSRIYMMASEHLMAEHFFALKQALYSVEKAEEAFTAEISVILANVRWFPVPSPNWHRDPQATGLDLYQINRDHTPPMHVVSPAVAAVVKQFRIVEASVAVELLAKREPLKAVNVPPPSKMSDDRLLDVYNDWREAEGSVLKRICQSIISVLHVRYDRWISRSSVIKYGNERREMRNEDSNQDDEHDMGDQAEDAPVERNENEVIEEIVIDD